MARYKFYIVLYCKIFFLHPGGEGSPTAPPGYA